MHKSNSSKNSWRDMRYPSSSSSVFEESDNSSRLAGSRRHKIEIENNGVHPKFDRKEWNEDLNRGLKSPPESKRMAISGHKYKELFSLRAKKDKMSDDLLGRKDKQPLRDGYVAEADGSNKVGETIPEKSSPSGQGKVSQKQQTSSCDATQISNNEKETPPGLNLNSTSDKDHHACLADSSQDGEIQGGRMKCVVCGNGGKLLSCAGKGCSRSFHLSCVDPSFTYDQLGVWHCIWCVKRKIEMDVYAVSEGIESVLDAMKVSDNEEMQKQKKYLVKYKGLAHVHNRWIPEKLLLLEAPSIFAKYKKRNQKACWKKEWSVPERLLTKRLLLFPEQCCCSFQEHDDCHYEWFVKWTGLDYDQATWELDNASFLRTPGAMKLICDFESRHEKAQKELDHFEEEKIKRPSFSELKEFPVGGFDHLIYVNKLLEYWNKDQNALVIDDQGRVVKVVSFAMYLLKKWRGPILIITTFTALSKWEAEFMRCASFANVVVYKGSRNTRSIIRAFEFYNEYGDIMFEVLLSHYAAVTEDLDDFKSIMWEVIVIDEWQRPTILAQAEKIKLLAANMRVLLVSSQIKDWSFNYHSALLLLDPDYDGTAEDILETNPSIETCKLKERLVHFTAYECKSKIIQFVEFWVPVMLTDVQIEQYCASLFSNSMLLCSCLKSDSTSSLHDILISTRQCSDHPFLANWSLRNSVLKDIPATDHFDVEIQLSGKLQLLHKILSEIERRGLRVVIFFQSIGGSEKNSIGIGDILDDFIHKKFGQDSYARIDGNISRSTKQAVCDAFNCKGNGKFVCLVEARACVPSTKLSSIDTIIIFNSDWDPLNDLKALQKITIESQFEQMKIFRLYSSCTVEEKVLILAKEGMTYDSNIKDIKKSICHKLLTWGACLLFSKIDSAHESNVSSSNSISSCEQTLLEDVICELSLLLPSGSGENSSSDYSSMKDNSGNVLKVTQNRGSYHGKCSLLGELIAQSKDDFLIIRRLMDAESPDIFWMNLFKVTKPTWKYIHTPLQRIKRKVYYWDGLPEETERKDGLPEETGNERGALKKGRTEASTIVNHSPKVRSMMKRTSQNLFSTRYRQVHSLIQDVVVGQDGKELRTSCDSDSDAHQHCELANLSILGKSAGGDLAEGESGDSLAECGLLPYELLLLTNSTSTGDGASMAIQNGCNIFASTSSGQAQASVGTSMQGLTCQFTTCNQQPTVSVDGSETVAAILGNANSVPCSLSSHPETFPRTSQAAHSGPLQKQMQRIEEAMEKTKKLHNDLKLHLKSECEKELEEIHKKYDLLLQKAETALAQTKTSLDTCYNIAYEQNSLAKAILLKQEATSETWSQRMQEDDVLTNNIVSNCLPQPSGRTISGPSPAGNPPPSQGMSNLSAVKQAAGRVPATPEEDSTGPRTIILAPVTAIEQADLQKTLTPATLRADISSTSLQMIRPLPQMFVSQVITQPLEALQASGRTTAGYNQSPARPEMTGSPVIPSEPMHTPVTLTNHLRPLSIPTFRPARIHHSGRAIRAPAPHLRHTRPLQ